MRCTLRNWRARPSARSWIWPSTTWPPSKHPPSLSPLHSTPLLSSPLCSTLLHSSSLFLSLLSFLFSSVLCFLSSSPSIWLFRVSPPHPSVSSSSSVSVCHSTALFEDPALRPVWGHRMFTRCKTILSVGYHWPREWQTVSCVRPLEPSLLLSACPYPPLL